MAILDASISKSVIGGPSFSFGHRLRRLVWMIVWGLLASWTPPMFHAWRRAVLRFFGARIGRGVRVYGGARVWFPPDLVLGDYAVLGPGVNCYNQAPITIGARAVVSQGAHLCAGSHDISDPNFQLIAKPIVIGANAWIAAEAFVGPGVVVGEGAVLGARGCAFSRLEAWTVYVGNPAKALRPRVFRADKP